jgi:signal peptidase II
LSPLKKIIRLFLFLTLLTLPIDQGTKEFARAEYLLHEDLADTTIYQGKRETVLAQQFGQEWMTINLTYVRNHGASWGIMKDLSEGLRRPVLIIVGLFLAAGFLLAAAKLQNSGVRKAAVSLALMLAGAVGNFVDRVRIGYVVDFVTVRGGAWGQTWSLPAFNFADIVIVIGLFWLIYIIISSGDQKVN